MSHPNPQPGPEPVPLPQTELVEILFSTAYTTPVLELAKVGIHCTAINSHKGWALINNTQETILNTSPVVVGWYKTRFPGG